MSEHTQLPLLPTLILGSGAWGQTIQTLAEYNQHPVTLISRDYPESMQEQLLQSRILISAVSMKGVRPTIEKLQHYTLPPDMIIVSGTKGLEAKTYATPLRLWQEAFPHNPVAVLSGPNIAAEIQQGMPAVAVISSFSAEAAQCLQHYFSSAKFRVYLNHDPIGTELGGILKNVFAIAAGVCDGLQLGINAKAALITRALAEMIRFGTALGGKPETFWGLSGLGDSIATCNSPRSRNYQVGFQMAQGNSLSQVLESLGSTAEGVNTVEVVAQWAAQEGVTLPITQEVQGFLQETESVYEAVSRLMKRPLRNESFPM